MVDAAPRRTPLHPWHVAAKADMTTFAGWSMPLSYSSILTEHMHVRRHAGLFDVCHMGRFVLRGPKAGQTISRLVPTSLGDMQPGWARYTVLLNESGGIKDDLIVYVRSSEQYLLVVNAANAAKDYEWLSQHLLEGVTLEDVSADTGLIALQGPAWPQVAGAAGAELQGAELLTGLPRFHFAEGRVAGLPAVVMRTGYTGEEGVELMMAADHVEAVWSALLAADGSGRALPCGLGARDTLRLEAALLLHGHDMDESTTPYEAGLGWLVDLDKEGPFIAREILVAQKEAGLSRVLAGVACHSRAIPRAGDELLHEGRAVGQVTSGSFSPVLGHSIALGYLPPRLAAPGTALEARVRGKLVPVETVKRPFYKAGVTPLPPEKGAREGDAGR